LPAASYELGGSAWISCKTHASGTLICVGYGWLCACFIFGFSCEGSLAEFCCNGTVVEDEELGQVIQLQGDQRKNVSQFLVQNQIAKKDLIKIHGF
jgi:Translation initiation factor SUI1